VLSCGYGCDFAVDGPCADDGGIGHGGIPGTFVCGAEAGGSNAIVCTTDQFCVQTKVGSGAGSYEYASCSAIPESCASNVTCGCIAPYEADAGQSCRGGVPCTQDGAGNITTTCALP
jgi:hypothetical protein